MAHDRRAFGRYHVLAQLGSGGMGHVFLAVNLGPAGVQKLVVIKQLRDDLAQSISARSMFLDEARISTRLNHPNIVQSHEVVDEGDDLYIVMEFLDGQPLSRLLDPANAKRFSLQTRVKILVEVCAGLHYAHELTDYDGTPLKIVHRDVSPHNIIVTYGGHIKIVDFGVAKAADATSVTASGVFKGKVRYAAPEQAMCLGIDRRADVFAVGTILWEMLTQRRMWEDQSDAAVLLALASAKIPSIRRLAPEAPKELLDICARSLSTEPSERYPTAEALGVALTEYLDRVGHESTADLGNVVKDTFDGDRRRLRGVVEQQIRGVRDASEGALTVRRIPVLSSDAIASESYVGGPRAGVAVESQGGAPPPKASGGHSAALVVAAVLGVAVIVGGGTWLASSRAKGAASAAPPTAKVDERVHIVARATPASAHLWLDGAPLATNPYEADVPRDDAPHTIAARADGFEPRQIEAKFSRDVALELALRPVEIELPAPAAPQASAASTSSPPPAKRKAAPTAKPQRSIDEEDPYR